MTESRLKPWLFMGMAATSIVAAGISLDLLVSSYEAHLDQLRVEPASVYVAVAARELYQGIAIEEGDLYAIQIPTAHVPEGSFVTPDHVIGRIPRERILPNEVVRGQRLSDPDAGIGLNATIPRGTRAISIEIADGAALAGLLHPSDYVDVLVTLTPDKGRTAVEETRTLLQAIYVLGVNGRMSDESADAARERRGAGKPTVTLLVTADEAEQVAHASAMGDIHLSLRNGTDIEEHLQMGGATKCLLRGGCVEEARVAPTAPQAPKVVCQPLDSVAGANKVVQWIDASGLPCEPSP